MKETEAREMLEILLLTIQKVKSNASEAIGDDNVGQKVLTEISKWIFGDKSIVIALNKILEQQNISGMDFFNIITTLILLVPPPILDSILIMGNLLDKFPSEPDIVWIIGWDDE